MLGLGLEALYSLGIVIIVELHLVHYSELDSKLYQVVQGFQYLHPFGIVPET